MSRVGKQPVNTKGVKINLEGGSLSVSGTKGNLKLSIPSQVELKIENELITVNRRNDDKISRALHGTIRVLISNMVTGVTQGFKKDLEIIGVGYKAQMKGKDLLLNVGFSNPVEIAVPEGIKVSVPRPTALTIEGIDKHAVGQFAAKVRRVRPPEPYKGKGIRYVDEYVRKKLGKALAK
ncbi:MAG: 50S ribosomal protein L6 [Candidatus Omnitrophica bacterium]|nr:50S ribosomal protein L6 [Candidatus Omnitrophota bacterium]